MAETKFEKGWVVQLKSGGPLMTVTLHEEDDFGEKVYCQWFNNTKPPQKLEYATFAPETLLIIKQ